MTTNESSKWEDWKDAIEDGLVFRSEKDPSPTNNDGKDLDSNPVVSWPAFSNQQLIRCEDGRSPDGHGTEDGNCGDSATMAPRMRRELRWKRVRGMQEVENLYDLGFWDNLRDILPSA